MIVCDLVRAFAVAGLALAPNLTVMLILVLIKGLFSATFSPARESYLLGSVPPDQLLSANSLSQISADGAKIIGPALGGLLIAAVGAKWVFLVDALAFLASALILSRLPEMRSNRSDGEHEESRFWDEFKAGILHVVRSRPLVAALVGMSVGFSVIVMYDSLSAAALKSLGMGESLLGLVVGTVGLGTTLGAGLIGQWGERVAPLSLMAAGKALTGFIVAGVGAAILAEASIPVFFWMPAFLIVGGAVAAIMVPFTYTIQMNTPQEMIGRVYSAANSVQTAFQLASPVVGALIAERMGVGTLFTAAGILLAVVGGSIFTVSQTWARSSGQIPALSTQQEEG